MASQKAGSRKRPLDLTDDFLNITPWWNSDNGEQLVDDPGLHLGPSNSCGSRAPVGSSAAQGAAISSCKEVMRPVTVDAEDYHMKPLSLGGNVSVFDINLHEGPQSRQNVERYYSLCKNHANLHVTTSCFTIWRKHKKTNGYAKVIPAVRAGGEDVRIFFFDDNLEWDGFEDSPGICNLRDVATGDFVDFCEGKNGFCRGHAARHTVIYHSTKYKNVLVKANILDAMEDQQYFASIIKRFSQPHEKIIVFMDVNSTIVCNDSVQGKDLGNTLLGTLFEFIELNPREAFELIFDAHPPLKIEKLRTFKQLVKDMTSGDHLSYSSFWTEEKCWRLFIELAGKGEVRWAGQDSPFSLEQCRTLFKEYMVTLDRVISKDGIPESWFHVFKELNAHGNHNIVLNSFGVDTRKVILATVPDERQALQVAVNYELWDSRDMQKFQGQFKS
mmetsp:Transcript_1245/g.2854  ORF Transcript_1245/g.2854 Transcript_1245/m.2854 type:complete len:443 (+) Transcript_1245:128-1456(+)|eukprot:CAMPEP_0115237508 /NCGR_PEP_ID=MMETSP0270-20121206/36400_1 /TAXON_ID=71861 /ORGANISM="Scrippsiella trochoidea, Strain CCMP3099" /LENGTH=442 /DNA_ID=CAMNT_0002652399 /DNA_START=64 /DNA_END=1392 /DNA_ORIENTATION=+